MRALSVVVTLSLSLGLVFAQPDYSNRRQTSRSAKAPEPPEPRGSARFFVMLSDPSPNLEKITRNAQLIVDVTVEKILGPRLRNPSVANSFNTDVLLSVNRVLRGQLGESKIITFHWGGTNGYFEAQAVQDPPMRPGERYIFFLKSDRRPGLPTYSIPGASRYYRVGIWNGSFGIRREKVFAAPRAAPALKEHSGMDLAEFVRDVERFAN